MPVSELTALKIENSALRIQQLQTAIQALVAEQKPLVEQARAEADAAADAIYDIQSRTFQAKPGN